jgi:hypothetical protein
MSRTGFSLPQMTQVKRTGRARRLAAGDDVPFSAGVPALSEGMSWLAMRGPHRLQKTPRAVLRAAIAAGNRKST